MEAFVKKIANVISTPIFRGGLLCGAVSVALAAAIWPTVAQSQQQAAIAAATVNTASPIKHVIVVVGENRTFDHVFGAYTPRQGQTVANLLSKGILYGKHTKRYQSAAVRHARSGAGRRGRDDGAVGRRTFDHRRERLADA